MKRAIFRNHFATRLVYAGGGECHVEALEERCGAGLHAEDWGGAVPLGVPRPAGAGQFLLATEGERLPVLDPPQQGLRGCFPPHLCHTNKALPHHSPKWRAMKTT